MGDGDLGGEEHLLQVVEPAVAAHAGKLYGEVCAGDWGDVGRDIGVGGGQRRDGRVPEVVAGRDTLDLAERGVSRADDGDGARGDGAAVVGGQVACVAEGLEGSNDSGEGGCAVGLDVDEEVQRLAARGVIDAVPGRPRHEGAVWVLTLQHGQDGLDVQAVQGAVVGQGGLLVAYVEGPVVQPDVGLDADCASFEG